MSKINILFDNKKYNVDESSLSGFASELQSHISSVMNGSGATINFGGTSYNIDSSKLSTEKNDFVSHLGTIGGNGHKVVVNGTQYGINSANLSDAIAELHAVLSGLHVGEGGSDDNEEPEYVINVGLEYVPFVFKTNNSYHEWYDDWVDEGNHFSGTNFGRYEHQPGYVGVDGIFHENTILYNRRSHLINEYTFRCFIDGKEYPAIATDIYDNGEFIEVNGITISWIHELYVYKLTDYDGVSTWHIRCNDPNVDLNEETHSFKLEVLSYVTYAPSFVDDYVNNSLKELTFSRIPTEYEELSPNTPEDSRTYVVIDYDTVKTYSSNYYKYRVTINDDVYTCESLRDGYDRGVYDFCLYNKELDTIVLASYNYGYNWDKYDEFGGTPYVIFPEGCDGKYTAPVTVKIESAMAYGFVENGKGSWGSDDDEVTWCEIPEELDDNMAWVPFVEGGKIWYDNFYLDEMRSFGSYHPRISNVYNVNLSQNDIYRFSVDMSEGWYEEFRVGVKYDNEGQPILVVDIYGELMYVYYCYETGEWCIGSNTMYLEEWTGRIKIESLVNVQFTPFFNDGTTWVEENVMLDWGQASFENSFTLDNVVMSPYNIYKITINGESEQAVDIGKSGLGKQDPNMYLLGDNNNDIGFYEYDDGSTLWYLEFYNIPNEVDGEPITLTVESVMPLDY